MCVRVRARVKELCQAQVCASECCITRRSTRAHLTSLAQTRKKNARNCTWALIYPFLLVHSVISKVWVAGKCYPWLTLTILGPVQFTICLKMVHLTPPSPERGTVVMEHTWWCTNLPRLCHWRLNDRHHGICNAPIPSWEQSTEVHRPNGHFVYSALYKSPNSAVWLVQLTLNELPLTCRMKHVACSIVVLA